MALSGSVPEPGDEVLDAGIVFRVLDMKNLLIDRVLVAPQWHPILSQSEEASP